MIAHELVAVQYFSVTQTLITFPIKIASHNSAVIGAKLNGPEQIFELPDGLAGRKEMFIVPWKVIRGLINVWLLRVFFSSFFLERC